MVLASRARPLRLLADEDRLALAEERPHPRSLILAPEERRERLHLELEATLYPGLTDAIDGRVRVPTEPGLGPDPDVIDRYRIA